MNPLDLAIAHYHEGGRLGPARRLRPLDAMPVDAPAEPTTPIYLTGGGRPRSAPVPGNAATIVPIASYPSDDENPARPRIYPDEDPEWDP
jgi:hypothetical protein